MLARNWGLVKDRHRMTSSIASIATTQLGMEVRRKLRGLLGSRCKVSANLNIQPKRFANPRDLIIFDSCDAS